jgi:hypothetical protein
MTPDKPTLDHPLCSWQYYVSAGSTPAVRRARLDECPVELRKEVEVRVRKFFEERARAR